MNEKAKLDEMSRDIAALVDKEAGDTLAKVVQERRSFSGDGFASTVPPFQSDMQRFMAAGENLLRSTRKRILDADAQYREKRANIVNAMTDELHRLDQEHDRKIAELRAIIGKIEAMRVA